ncbi:hypothetical protein D3C81_1917020 [compost metagenome]
MIFLSAACSAFPTVKETATVVPAFSSKVLSMEEGSVTSPALLTRVSSCLPFAARNASTGSCTR